MVRDTPESEVIQQVKSVIRATGLKLQRINTGCFTVGEGRNRRYVRTAEAGTLDFEGYDNRGRFCAIECKRPSGGRLSPAQRERIEDINRKGGVAFVAHGGGEALQKLKDNGCLGWLPTSGTCESSSQGGCNSRATHRRTGLIWTAEAEAREP